MVATFRGEFWVWPVAAEASGHGLRQLAHNFALMAGDFLVDRGVVPVQELIVLFLRQDKSEFDDEIRDSSPFPAPVQQALAL